MATLWKTSYRNVMDSGDWEAQVSTSLLYHTEMCECKMGKDTPPLLLRLLGSEESCKVLTRLLHCRHRCSLHV